MSGLVFDLPWLIPPRAAGEKFTLQHDWTVIFRGEFYHIPGGFETDGASIPRWLWRICGHPLESPRIFAAIVHDYLYAGGDPEATRADADDLYRDLLLALGVSRLKAHLEWLALRLCGRSHWHKNQKGEKMNKLIIIAAFVAASVVTGCKSVEVNRRGHQVALDEHGEVVRTAAGEPVVLDLGWSVDYFQHWNWQKFDALRAKTGEAEFELNGYEGGASASNLVAIVSISLNGVAKITEKVAAAIVTSGGSVAADFGQSLIQQAAERFVAKGGDPETAKVECKDGSCTICDADGVCEVCEDCYLKPAATE